MVTSMTMMYVQVMRSENCTCIETFSDVMLNVYSTEIERHFPCNYKFTLICLKKLDYT